MPKVGAVVVFEVKVEVFGAVDVDFICPIFDVCVGAGLALGTMTSIGTSFPILGYTYPGGGPPLVTTVGGGLL